MEGQSMAKMNLVDRDESLDNRKHIVPRKAALIACPWTFYDHVEFRSQQLGLGYVGAYSKERFGHNIVFIDPMINGGDQVRIPVKTKYQQTNRFLV